LSRRKLAWPSCGNRSAGGCRKSAMRPQRREPAR
jgi:hypothetical protein